MELVNCGFKGLGICLPERVMTNKDFEKIVETSDEWITTRTGIKERRFASEDEAASDLAVKAAQKALDDAGMTPGDLDMIICATFTGDNSCPNTACRIQAALGENLNIPAFDLSAACSGFTYGCSVAAGFIRSGMYRTILVIGVEVLSKILDMTDRNTCVLFGDGAGAAVIGVEEREGYGLLGQTMGAKGRGADFIAVPAGGSRKPFSAEVLAERSHYLTMNGAEVFKFAVNICARALMDALEDTGTGLTGLDLDLVFPHQANVRILENASKRLKFPMDKFVINLDKYGNTSAASVPLAMGDARADGRLKEDTLFGMVAFGGGLTYAASIWRW